MDQGENKRTPPKKTKKAPSTMRYLGEFFGEIAKGVKAKVPAPKNPPSRAADAPITLRRTTVEERPDASGAVVRRTVIEEVVVPPGTPVPPLRDATSQ
jgi:hypothetical protein